MAKTKTTGPVKAPVPTAMLDSFQREFSLVALLERNEILTGHATLSHAEVAARVVAMLTVEEQDAVSTFARAVAWLAEPVKGVLTTATAEQVSASPALVAGFEIDGERIRLRDDIATVDAIRGWTEAGQVIGEDVKPPIAEPTGQLTLVTDTPAAPKPVTNLAFASSDEVASVTVALEHRAEALEKEAKKLAELGRHTEAKALLRESRHINDALLAQLQAQGTLPFNASESPLAAVTRIVGSTVRTAVVRAIKNPVAVGEGESVDEVVQRRLADLADFERLIGGVAEHAAAAVLPVLRDVAERAYEAGKASREQSPETLVRDAVQAHGAQRAAA